MTDTDIEGVVERVLKEKFDHYLEDISWRINQAYEVVGRVESNEPSRPGRHAKQHTIFAEDLNIQDRAFLTGYTVTPNSPGAGSIAWADLHVVYGGVDRTITNGNTALKYAWWSPTTTPTVLQSSNTKPTLAAGEVLIFRNDAGTPVVMLSDTNASLPKAIADGTVDAGAILANAVTSAAIADGAVVAAGIGPNAITSVKIADGAVIRTGQLGANVVSSTAVADGAILRAGQLVDNVVATAKLAANAVDSTKLADNAATVTKIAANAVTNVKIADGAIARPAQLNTNVVSTAAIQPNAVTHTEIASGSVDPTNLNILRHILY